MFDNKFQIERVCVVNSMYSLLQYFLLSTEEEINRTYYFWGEAISDSVKKYFEGQSVDILQEMESIQKKVKMKSPELEEYFYCDYFPSKWPFLMKDGIFYFGHDHLPCSPYVLREHPFELLEDGMLNYHKYPFSACDDYVSLFKDREDKFGPLNILQVDYAGQEEQCRIIHLTGISKTDYIVPEKVRFCSLEEMWTKANKKKISLINTIYAFKKELLGYLDNKRVLITQPLSEDKFLSEKEKMHLYSRIMDYIGRDNLVIKKHPRDISNYDCCNVESVTTNIPLQLLSLNGIRFSEAITISSTAVFDFNYPILVTYLGTQISPKLFKKCPNASNEKVQLSNPNIRLNQKSYDKLGIEMHREHIESLTIRNEELSSNIDMLSNRIKNLMSENQAQEQVIVSYKESLRIVEAKAYKNRKIYQALVWVLGIMILTLVVGCYVI